MDPHSQIVIASSDLESRRRSVQILERLGIDALETSSVSHCRAILTQQNVGLIFCDRRLKDGWYTDVLRAAAYTAGTRKVRVVLMSSDVDSLEYHAAREAGIFEVIASPCRPTDLEWMVILARRAEKAKTKQLVTNAEPESREFRIQPGSAQVSAVAASAREMRGSDRYRWP